MRRDSFFGQVLMAVARSAPADSSIPEIATGNGMNRPPSQLVTAIARSTPAFTPGSTPALEAVQRRTSRSPEPAASLPHASTRAGNGKDILEFGLRVPSSRRRRSYRQALTVALAGFAIPVIVASIVFIETAENSGPGSASTPPPLSAGSASPTPIAGRSSGSSAAPGASSTYNALLSRIPVTVKGSSNCTNIGTDVGATAVAECSKIQGLAAMSIFYYSFTSQSALNSGFNSFLSKESFKKGQTSCATGANQFTNFVVQCEGGFTSTSPAMSGNIAEYTNTDNAPIIVSTDNQQLVMVVMIGANDGNLLAYWKQFEWIVTSG